MSSRPSQKAFTLIEMLTVIVIALLLMGLLLPVISLIREQVSRRQAATTVAMLHQALQLYASEDRRHRYPPAATDLSLSWAPPEAAPAAGVLNLLENQHLEFPRADLNRQSLPFYQLLDPWHRPYRYQVDEDLLGASGAQRPLPLIGWNTLGSRPWGYVWSLGKDAAADGSSWIYQRD